MNEREQELLVTGYVAGYMDKEAADAGKPGVMDSIGSSLKGALNYVKNKTGEATDYMGGKAEDIWNNLSEKERIALLTGAGAAGGAGIGAEIAGGPGAAIGAGVGGLGAGAGYAAGYSNRDALAKMLRSLSGKKDAPKAAPKAAPVQQGSIANLIGVPGYHGDDAMSGVMKGLVTPKQPWEQ